MKAYDRKKRLTVSQRDVLKKCVVDEFTKYKAQYEKKCNDRIFFLHYLALAMVLDEELGYGEKRRAKILNACMKKVAENSTMLSSIFKGLRNLPKSTTSLGMRASLLMLRRKYNYARDII